MRWFFKRRKEFNSEKEGRLRLRDIPRIEKFAENFEGDRRNCSCFKAISLDDLVGRYAALIHIITDNLPLNEIEIDRLLMPLIWNSLALVHLIPASEFHHHSRSGGLFEHMLEAAGIGVRLATQKMFDIESEPEQKYVNHPKWFVAVVVVLFIHDLGKLCDVLVIDDKGRVWNPNEKPLYVWLQSGKCSVYYVSWKESRVHKEHERRCLRFAYRNVLTPELISYLSEEGNQNILNAIEDAVLINKGPLACILLQADGNSVAQDCARAKRFVGEAVSLSSPMFVPIVDAIRENLESGRWQVNVPSGVVFVTKVGAFLRDESRTGTMIRDMAVSRGHAGVPSALSHQARILADGGAIETTDNGDVTLYQLTIHNQTISCLRILEPELFFPKGAPSAVEINVIGPKHHHSYLEKGTSGLDLTCQSTDYTALVREGLKADDAEKKTSVKAQRAVESDDRISQSELSEILNTPLEKEAAKHFVERLLADALTQLRGDGGTLVFDRTVEDEVAHCSSCQVETVAKNHGISAAALEALFEVLSIDKRFKYDAKQHLFFWSER